MAHFDLLPVLAALDHFSRGALRSNVIVRTTCMDHVIEFNLFEGFHDDVECILLQSVDGCGNHPEDLGYDNEDLQALQFHVFQKAQAAEARYFQGDDDGRMSFRLWSEIRPLSPAFSQSSFFRHDRQDSAGDQPVHCESLLHYCDRL